MLDRSRHVPSGWTGGAVVLAGRLVLTGGPDDQLTTRLLQVQQLGSGRGQRLGRWTGQSHVTQGQTLRRVIRQEAWRGVVISQEGMSRQSINIVSLISQ